MIVNKRVFSLVFGLFLVMLLFSGFAFAATWYVDGNVGASSSGTSWSSPFKTIQEAVSVAHGTDEVWVKKGVYPITSDILITEPIRIYGGFSGTDDKRDRTTNITTLDGQVPYDETRPRYHLVVRNSAIIDGLAFTRFVTVIETQDCSPVIRNCSFFNNFAAGAAFSTIVNQSSSPLISNCNFYQNNHYFGGAIRNENSSPTIVGCTFSDNWGESGGAIYNVDSSVVITNCTFSGNKSYLGSAIFDRNSVSLIDSCTFTNPDSSGGPIAVTEGSSTTIRNCIFSRNFANFGGAIRNWGSLSIINSTFWGNEALWDGGAIANYSSLTVTNSILWGNTSASGSEPEIYSDSLASTTVTYSDIQGGYPGEGNIDADPLFVDPANDDFHLQRGSPCIDKGTGNTPLLPSTDFEGDSRIAGFAPDMGADEFVHRIRIDIRPLLPNIINLWPNWGIIPVSILSAKDFNAPNKIDRHSLTFGATGDKDSLVFCDDLNIDVNRDRYRDLTCYFYKQYAGFECGDVKGILKGKTVEGLPIEGRDSVIIIPCK
jgi:hypothetical protein